jgi:hypothetical protein
MGFFSWSPLRAIPPTIGEILIEVLMNLTNRLSENSDER